MAQQKRTWHVGWNAEREREYGTSNGTWNWERATWGAYPEEGWGAATHDEDVHSSFYNIPPQHVECPTQCPQAVVGDSSLPPNAVAHVRGRYNQEPQSDIPPKVNLTLHLGTTVVHRRVRQLLISMGHKLYSHTETLRPRSNKRRRKASLLQ
jgi:hypothetical protein